MREKGRKTKKPWKIKAFRGYIFFIALIWLPSGIFHCPPQSHSRNAREACFASFLLALWGIAARKQRTVLFSLAHPLPPSAKRPKVVHRFKSTQAKKEKTHHEGVFFLFWLRGWDLNLTTSGLWARRATKLLYPAILNFWQIVQRKMVPEAGIEPVREINLTGF